jgi:hypothetical protein
MAENSGQGGLSTGAKIGIAIGVFVLLSGAATIAVVATRKKSAPAGDTPIGPSAGNGQAAATPFYASTDTYNKVALGRLVTWLDKQTDSEMQNYWAAERGLFGEKKFPWNGGQLDAIGAAVDGWFKGMNLRRRSDYVYMFKDDIKKYIESGGPPHWDVATGEYLNTKV